MNAVDSQLFTTSCGDAFSSLRQQLWSTLDEEIALTECDIYRYESENGKNAQIAILTLRLLMIDFKP